MQRLAALIAVTLACAPAARAQECTYAGHVPSYVQCIAAQAWDALTTADIAAADNGRQDLTLSDHEGRVATNENSIYFINLWRTDANQELDDIGCPLTTLTQLGTACVNLQCRGNGETFDSSVRTWAEADAACQSYGYRLCTAPEVAETVNGGCGFDGEFLAVQTSDGAPRAYVRGFVRNTDGTCGPNAYRGENFATAWANIFPDSSGCDDALINLVDQDSHVDGFYCCWGWGKF